MLLEEFQGTAAAEYGTATALVGVFDGELTVNATGGTNTKIAWVRVRSAGTTAADSQPFVVATGRPTARWVHRSARGWRQTSTSSAPPATPDRSSRRP